MVGIEQKLEEGQTQKIKSRPRARTHANARNSTIGIPINPGRTMGGVDLVPHDDLGNTVRTDLGQNEVDGLDLVVAVLARCIDHMQQQVGLSGFL